MRVQVGSAVNGHIHICRDLLICIVHQVLYHDLLHFQRIIGFAVISRIKADHPEIIYIDDSPFHVGSIICHADRVYF